jgi:ATP-dependent DNA ligase
MGLEGIVSKRVGSRYVSGRTRAWLKTKNPDFDGAEGATSKTRRSCAGELFRVVDR